jgi:hypothetical protein
MFCENRTIYIKVLFIKKESYFMALIVPDVGKVELLKYMLKVSTSQNQILHLYSNDPTISDLTVLEDLNEVSGSGYSSISINGTSWTVNPTNTAASYPDQTFSLTGAIVAYGYFVTNADGDLLWCERFTNAPFSIPISGGQIAIALNISLSDCL